MTALALALVLASAVLHASWNLLAKRARGGVPFVWLFSGATFALFAPAALAFLAWSRPRLEPVDGAFIVGSALLHVGYFVALQRGYRNGDLSLVYPLARGVGPLLATGLAVLLLGERPSALALSGTLIIVASAFVLSGGAWPAGQRRALGWGLVTAVFIAGYSVWDAVAVDERGIHPLLYLWLSEGARWLLLTPPALRRRQEVVRDWRERRAVVLGVAVLSPLAYGMVLFAFRLAPVSYVAPAREISILVGVLLGTRLLAEGDARRRLLAAAGMVAGVTLLALG